LYPEISWSVIQGADAFIENPHQWKDSDEDGFGENFDDPNGIVDLCPTKKGTSTIDRYGCPDSDGDGYSNEDAFWQIGIWSSLGYGPDVFPSNPTQWYDSDGDNFGDNWGNPEWNETREDDWPGQFVENATDADMCPFEVPDGKFDDDIYYPGCLLDEPSDGGKITTDDTSSSDDEGVSTVTIVGIIAGIIVIALIGVIVVIINKEPLPNKKPEPNSKPSGPKELTDLPPPSPPSAKALPLSEDVTEFGETSDDPNTVGSWEDLPAGDYLDPDENGTNWFKANNGDNWYQNADETWTKWLD
jgi:hypothetical protein